jgi:hypothetical protein
MRMPEGTIEVKCEHCGEPVFVTLEEEAKGDPIYCSDYRQELDESFAIHCIEARIIEAETELHQQLGVEERFSHCHIHYRADGISITVARLSDGMTSTRFLKYEEQS